MGLRGAREAKVELCATLRVERWRDRGNVVIPGIADDKLLVCSAVSKSSCGERVCYFWVKRESVRLATSCRASSSIGRSFFRLRLALLRMLLQTRGVKKYSLDTSEVGSRISENEHSGAVLRKSEVLRVKYSPRKTVPAFAQRPDEGTKVHTSV